MRELSVRFTAYVPESVANVALALWSQQDADKAVVSMLVAESWRPFEAHIADRVDWLERRQIAAQGIIEADETDTEGSRGKHQ